MTWGRKKDEAPTLLCCDHGCDPEHYMHQVDKIEAEKLKAVGLRNKVAALEEVSAFHALMPLRGQGNSLMECINVTCKKGAEKEAKGPRETPGREAGGA